MRESHEANKGESPLGGRLGGAAGGSNPIGPGSEDLDQPSAGGPAGISQTPKIEKSNRVERRAGGSEAHAATRETGNAPNAPASAPGRASEPPRTDPPEGWGWLDFDDDLELGGFLLDVPPGWGAERQLEGG